jgi:hypothetical protein
MKETEQNEGDEVESEMGKGKGRGGGRYEEKSTNVQSLHAFQELLRASVGLRVRVVELVVPEELGLRSTTDPGTRADPTEQDSAKQTSAIDQSLRPTR